MYSLCQPLFPRSRVNFQSQLFKATWTRSGLKKMEIWTSTIPSRPGELHVLRKTMWLDQKLQNSYWMDVVVRLSRQIFDQNCVFTGFYVCSGNYFCKCWGEVIQKVAFKLYLLPSFSYKLAHLALSLRVSSTSVSFHSVSFSLLCPLHL